MYRPDYREHRQPLSIEKELIMNIGNVSYDLTEEDSKHAFEGIGKDQLGNIIKDTGRVVNRKIQFSKDSTRAEANSAIRGLRS
jgi:hypothetical protein